MAHVTVGKTMCAEGDLQLPLKRSSVFTVNSRYHRLLGTCHDFLVLQIVCCEPVTSV
jgi:hypothetical protein